ncbi:hypothetical protein [Gordonia sp. 'Campus']|uniref:hypothetical protein n=1 Tax=Gordonia sp. 'Campus' TaxID=2915824 RepID=UPI001EE47743|nr:hypothetical protein [Gordonia sp. 'Campus']
MGTSQAVGTTVRPLTDDDRPAALDLLGPEMREVPVYRWLIGEDAPDDAYRWYADVLFTDLLPGIRGMFAQDGRLIALIAVAEPDHSAQPVGDELAARSQYYVTALPGFIARFRELQQRSAACVVPGAVSIVFALVHPDHRQAGSLTGLMEPVLTAALGNGARVTTSTADQHMADVYIRKWSGPHWSGRIYDEFTLTDGPTVWFVEGRPRQTEQPPD